MLRTPASSSSAAAKTHHPVTLASLRAITTS
jgi:hypothetical protein